MHASALKSRTILHLTDLHFGPVKSKGHYWNSESTELELPEHDRRGLLGSLLDDLARQELKPDLVLVTGDLVDRGAASGVIPARDFLSKLAEGLGLVRGRVVLVPGNHDVRRVPDPAQRYAGFDKLRDGFYGTLREPFPRGTAPHLRVERFDFAAELGIEVLAFNSCEALDPPRQEHGSIGQAQRRRAEALLAPSEGRGLFRIALMHHHLHLPTGVVRKDISVMDDAGTVREWLADHRFHLALHGHQHVDWEHREEIRGWSLAIAAGGSAGVGRYGRSTWDLRLGYQVLALDSPERGRRIRREYDPQSRRWVAAAGRDGPETRLRFGGGTGAPGGREPAKASLRLVLAKLFPLPEDLDAFCIDHFEDVARQLNGEMSYQRKLNILFKMRGSAEILEKLRQHCGEALAKHEALLTYV